MECHRCGERWTVHPALTVACPECQAAAGRACRRPSGHAIFGGEVHVAREQLAVDRGLMTKCRGEGRSE